MRSLKDQGITRQPELDIEVERIGEEIGIRVRDNGIGIPLNLREHVFVPFFTTKPPGEGTGLGLGLCRDIVVGLHNGELEMESEQGVGTTVRITTPVNEALMLPRHRLHDLFPNERSARTACVRSISHCAGYAVGDRLTTRWRDLVGTIATTSAATARNPNAARSPTASATHPTMAGPMTRPR